ncbi:MAG: phosphopyruvate hydratase [Acidobacteria bacterium]|nr:phosphopyruvate hydratase [Acidobacteriota bacterium]
MAAIRAIDALEVIDSRGNPTVEARVHLDGGTTGVARVPSGASTGEREATELRDGGARYGGKGVRQAVANVNGEINRALAGCDAADQQALDQRLIELDGTPNKARLGANAILGVSMAAARAAADAAGVPLYRHLGGDDAAVLPVPCLNVINGGRPADNTGGFQEFKIAPYNAPTFAEALRMGIEAFHALRALLKDQGKSTGIGDEGGFAPDLATNEEAVELILAAIEKAGYRPGADIALCLDPATSEMWNDGGYVAFKSDQSVRTTGEMIDLWSTWIDRYPIVLIEDALAENDWDGWAQLTAALGDKIELVGDDVFCTNPGILRRAIDGGVGNSILVKLNQIGTVSETLETVRLAQANGYGAYMSHRSGETEDTFIADLAVATGCGHIKTGSGCRGERTAKFNRLLRIEHDLGDKATFPGLGGFRQTVI